jgi:hypothetical protein
MAATRARATPLRRWPKSRVRRTAQARAVSFDPADAALLAAIFGLGGLVKGVAGFGLPTVTLGLLALTRPLPEAMALAVLPTIVTNIWQAFMGGALRPALRRHGMFLIAACLCTALAAGHLARADAAVLAGALGLLMMASAALTLARPRLPAPSPARERWLSPIMGGASGAITGLTGSFMMPAAPWLAALRLPPDAFVQAFALGAVTATVTLAVALAAQGLMPPRIGLASAAALAPALLGMALGRALRGRLPETVFRRVVQSCLLALGLYLVLRNLG